MKVIRNIREIEYDKKTAVSVGTFDGVHSGHRKIIDKLNSVRDSKGLRSVLITFDPHPQIVLKNRAKDIRILSTLEEKLEIFSQLNIDITYVINFTKDFANTTADDFYKNYLIDKIGLNDLVLGYDHMFGKNREGNYDTLKELSAKYEFTVDRVDEYKPDDFHISSSVLRELLSADGNVKKAAIILGRNYSIEGTVVEGKKLGRELGYPTANIKIPDEFKLIPAIGIYAVEVILNGNTYTGMMSIGRNPTVTDDKSIKLEVNIFDFNDDIYGEKIKIGFIDRIREEIKFENIDKLRTQLHSDKKISLEILNK
ncbi:MAG: bifunctional riboflavin kinase/FAD synthetase [Ignavibacteria bacterium]|nr:bifunctional riboflavin kinase/FAD synthetase [Ignavibacteria bacterium]